MKIQNHKMFFTKRRRPKRYLNTDQAEEGIWICVLEHRSMTILELIKGWNWQSDETLYCLQYVSVSVSSCHQECHHLSIKNFS